MKKILIVMVCCMSMICSAQVYQIRNPGLIEQVGTTAVCTVGGIAKATYEIGKDILVGNTTTVVAPTSSYNCSRPGQHYYPGNERHVRIVAAPPRIVINGNNNVVNITNNNNTTHTNSHNGSHNDSSYKSSYSSTYTPVYNTTPVVYGGYYGGYYGGWGRYWW